MRSIYRLTIVASIVIFLQATTAKPTYVRHSLISTYTLKSSRSYCDGNRYQYTQLWLTRAHHGWPWRAPSPWSCRTYGREKGAVENSLREPATHTRRPVSKDSPITSSVQVPVFVSLACSPVRALIMCAYTLAESSRAHVWSIVCATRISLRSCSSPIHHRTRLSEMSDRKAFLVAPLLPRYDREHV